MNLPPPFPSDAYSDTLSNIIETPFLNKLADGTLPKSSFSSFLQQDRLFLYWYDSAVKAAQNLTSDNIEKAFLTKLSDASESEISSLGRMAGQSNEIDLIASYQKYCDHLEKSTDSSHLPSLLSALLPCPLLFNDISKWLRKNASSTTPYRWWIDLYTNSSHESIVKEFIQICHPYIINKNALNSFSISLSCELQLFRELS